MAEESLDSVDYNLKTTHKDDCFFVFDTENGSTIKVGAKKQFLISYSETFRRMLEESLLAEKGDVHLKDIKVDVFKNLLKWVYGGGDSFLGSKSVQELVDLMYVAEKYLFEGLKTKIVILIVERLSVDNICDVLSSPVCLGNEELEEELSDFLCIEIERVLQNKQFSRVESKGVLWVLQQLSLNTTEMTLWEALVDWAEKKFETEDPKELRSYILEHLKYIRFGTLSRDEFCEEVVPLDILPPEEVVEVIKHFWIGETTGQISLDLNSKPRKKILGKTKFSSVLNNIRSAADFKHRFDSPSFELCELKYNISIETKGNYMSFYLSRNASNKTTWKICYKCKMVLINQGGCKNVVKKFSKTNAEVEIWGYPEFIELAKLVDPKNGFIKNNSIIVMVELKITEIFK